MRLTYIYHSCFALEADKCILIFDYWKDSTRDDVKTIIDNTRKRVYFLSSHFHTDHFNKDIINFKVPHGEKRIILSNDIFKRRRASSNEADVFMKRGEHYEDNMIKVTTFGSTDIGVSFLVELENKKIFHAGDLNNWHWESESTKEEVSNMESRFFNILADIKSYTDYVDLAMFPVDPRLGDDFYRGARQWLETIQTNIFAPMHFSPQVIKTAMTFGEIAEKLCNKFLYIHHSGEKLGEINTVKKLVETE